MLPKFYKNYEFRVAGSNRWEITYCAESKRVDFDTKGSDILLLELSSQVTLDEGGLCELLAIVLGLLMRSSS